MCTYIYIYIVMYTDIDIDTEAEREAHSVYLRIYTSISQVACAHNLDMPGV